VVTPPRAGAGRELQTGWRSYNTDVAGRPLSLSPPGAARPPVPSPRAGGTRSLRCRCPVAEVEGGVAERGFVTRPWC